MPPSMKSDAEREARRAQHRIGAEHGDHDAERAGEQPLHQRRLDQPRDHRQREHEQREELPRPEPERELRQRRGGADEEQRRRAGRRRTTPRRPATWRGPPRPSASSESRRRWWRSTRACRECRCSMAVTSPPAEPPTYTPVIAASPCSGSRPKVNGSTTMMVMVMVTPGQRAADHAGERADDQRQQVLHLRTGCTKRGAEKLVHARRLEVGPAAARQQHGEVLLEHEPGHQRRARGERERRRSSALAFSGQSSSDAHRQRRTRRSRCGSRCRASAPRRPRTPRTIATTSA